MYRGSTCTVQKDGTKSGWKTAYSSVDVLFFWAGWISRTLASWCGFWVLEMEMCLVQTIWALIFWNSASSISIKGAAFLLVLIDIAPAVSLAIGTQLQRTFFSLFTTWKHRSNSQLYTMYYHYVIYEASSLSIALSGEIACMDFKNPIYGVSHLIDLGVWRSSLVAISELQRLCLAACCWFSPPILPVAPSSVERNPGTISFTGSAQFRLHNAVAGGSWIAAFTVYSIPNKAENEVSAVRVMSCHVHHSTAIQCIRVTVVFSSHFQSSSHRFSNAMKQWRLMIQASCEVWDILSTVKFATWCSTNRENCSDEWLWFDRF